MDFDYYYHFDYTRFFDLTRNNFQRIFNLRTDRGKSTFDSSIVRAISYLYFSDLLPFNENLLATF